VLDDLQSRFEKAMDHRGDFSSPPNRDFLLLEYALRQQGSRGDVQGARPGMFEMMAKAKYDAWATQKGKTKEAAMQEYVDLIEPRLRR